MKTVALVLLYMCSLSNFLCYGQNIILQEQYFTATTSCAHSVILTDDGNFVIAGQNNLPTADVAILKINTNGDTLWTRIYGGPLQDVAEDIEQTRDGGYIVAGKKDHIVDMITYLMQGKLWVLRLDSDGDTLWTKTFDSPHNDYAYSVSETKDDGFIVSGVRNNLGINSGGDAWILKLNSSGDSVWTKCYHPSASIHDLTECKKVIETYDSNYVFLSGAESNHNQLISKIGKSGNALIWQKTFNGLRITCVKEQIDHTLLFCGNTYTSYFLGKLSENGDSIWVKHYLWPTDRSFVPVDLYVDFNLHVFLAGHFYESNESYSFISMTNSFGDSICTFTDYNIEFLTSVERFPSGGIVVCGRSNVKMIVMGLTGMCNILPSTSVDEDENIRIYPNPSSDLVHVRLPAESNIEATIFNSKGQIIKNFSQVCTDDYSISLEEIIPGEYIIQVSVNANVYTRKLIIK